MWIGCLFHFTALAWRLARIEHDFGFIASEQDKTDHPSGIPQDASPEQDTAACNRLRFLVRNCVLLIFVLFEVVERMSVMIRIRLVFVLSTIVVVIHFDFPFKDTIVRIQICMRRLALNVELGPHTVVHGVDLVRGLQGAHDLQIGLAIQVLRFDIAKAIGLRSGQDDDIGGHCIIIPQIDKVADA